jgi:hypothetical protein
VSEYYEYTHINQAVDEAEPLATNISDFISEIKPLIFLTWESVFPQNWYGGKEKKILSLPDIEFLSLSPQKFTLLSKVFRYVMSITRCLDISYFKIQAASVFHSSTCQILVNFKILRFSTSIRLRQEWMYFCYPLDVEVSRWSDCILMRIS